MDILRVSSIALGSRIFSGRIQESCRTHDPASARVTSANVIELVIARHYCVGNPSDNQQSPARFVPPHLNCGLCLIWVRCQAASRRLGVVPGLLHHDHAQRRARRKIQAHPTAGKMRSDCRDYPSSGPDRPRVFTCQTDWRPSRVGRGTPSGTNRRPWPVAVERSDSQQSRQLLNHPARCRAHIPRPMWNHLQLNTGPVHRH